MGLWFLCTLLPIFRSFLAAVSWAEILEVRVSPLKELLSSPLKHMRPFLSERVITGSIVQVALADNG